MTINASFPAEVGVEIPDNWEKTHSGGIFWIAPNPSNNQTSHNKQNFRPRGIIIDRQDTDDTSTTALVRGILWSEGVNDWKTRRLATNVEHPRAYRAIDMRETNGRGIEINA